MNKQLLIDQLARQIVSDKVCSDLAATASQLVMGDGNPDADIVFIGEAPGKKEDETGLPFVGAAGKFLDEMLVSINMARSDIYTTNIVKYRPPNNRDPSPEEKQAFLPYLMQQLAIIGPKIVITLGRHSMNMFLPDQTISQAHGQPIRKKFLLKNKDGSGEFILLGDGEHRSEAYGKYGEREAQSSTKKMGSNSAGVSSLAADEGTVSWTILPLYHPAAALYNGGLRQTLLDDFAKIPSILNQI